MKRSYQYFVIRDTVSHVLYVNNANCSNNYDYLGADKSLVRPTSRCILFDGENISFDASLAIYI